MLRVAQGLFRQTSKASLLPVLIVLPLTTAAPWLSVMANSAPFQPSPKVSVMVKAEQTATELVKYWPARQSEAVAVRCLPGNALPPGSVQVEGLLHILPGAHGKARAMMVWLCEPAGPIS